MEIKTKYFSSENGFTLIELLIAVILIVVGLLAFGVFTGNLVVQNTTGERKTQASTYAQDKLEELKNQALNATLTAGDGSNDTLDNIYTRVWTVTVGAANATSVADVAVGVVPPPPRNSPPPLPTTAPGQKKGYIPTFVI